MEYPHFLGGSATAQSPSAGQESTVNWYPEVSESPGASQRVALYPTPGVLLLSSAVAGPGRGHFAGNGREFIVEGSVFYEVSSTGMLTSRGTVTLSADPVTICSNGDAGGEVMVTSGGNLYIFTLASNAFAAVGAMAGKATMGAQLDGYFLALDAATSTLYISDLLDGLTWDPTQFAQRAVASDRWVTLKVNNKYIWLLGSETSDVYYNSGDFPFPFIPHPSGAIPYGCAAAYSAKVANGQLVWLGQTATGNGAVYRASGFSPEAISTDPLQTALNGYVTIADAIGDVYDDLGHTFYVLTLPDADATWCWDFETNVWHERGTWESEDEVFKAWRPLFHAFAFGQHRMLDRAGAGIYQMSSAFGHDVEEREIRRVRRAPALVNENKRLYYGTFELLLEAGLGLPAGPVATPVLGSDPLVMLDMSNDGGKTWGARQLRQAGLIGEYKRRVRFTRCGSARQRVFQISVSDPVPWRVVNAFLEVVNAPQGAA